MVAQYEQPNTGGRMTVFGILAIILGIMAMLSPGLTGLSILTLLGLLVLGGGIVHMVWAFSAGGFGKALWDLAIGALTALCGIALIAHPLFASAVLTIILAAYFIIDGIIEIAAAIKRRGTPGWVWLLFSGIMSIVLGLIIRAQYPLSRLWAMGVLLGIKLFLIGLVMVGTGSAVRQMARA